MIVFPDSSASLSWREVVSMFSTTPSVCSNWRMVVWSWRSRTRFLPFNQGKFGGAGNPPVPPTRQGYATGYLWEETWARDSVLDLVRQFIHEVEEEDEKGRKTGKRFLIFPRYQQLD